MAHDLSPDDPGICLACQDLVELLTDYLSGALARPRWGRSAHLAVFPPCQAYLAHLGTVRLMGRIEATEQLCSEARSDVLDVFRDLMMRHAS